MKNLEIHGFVEGQFVRLVSIIIFFSPVSASPPLLSGTSALHSLRNPRGTWGTLALICNEILFF